MKVDIYNEDELLDKSVEIDKLYAGDLMLRRKGKRRFEFQSGYESRDFVRGYIKSVVGYLKGQGGYIVVSLVRVDET